MPQTLDSELMDYRRTPVWRRTEIHGDDATTPKNFEIIRTKDGGLKVKARLVHGQDNQHTLSLTADEVSQLEAMAAGYHDFLHGRKKPAATRPARQGGIAGRLELGCACGGEFLEEDHLDKI